MTIYGFFATIIICATVLGGVWLLSKFPFTINIRTIKATEAPKAAPVPVEKKTEVKEEAKNDKDKPVATVSMDAVIKAANELMGIQSTEEDK